jgi:hypothetical protein
MASDQPAASTGGILKSAKGGWDGKLRVGKSAELHQADDADEEGSDEEAFEPEVIVADEGEASEATKTGF